jgi:hypothetical protein
MAAGQLSPDTAMEQRPEMGNLMRKQTPAVMNGYERS